MRQRPAYIILIIISSTSISMSRLRSTAFGGLVLIWWSMCYIYISKYYLSSFPIWNKQALSQLLFLQYYISCHLSEPSYNSAVSDAHLPCLHNWLPAVNFPPVVILRLLIYIRSFHGYNFVRILPTVCVHGVPCFCNAKSVSVIATGMLSRYQSKIPCKLSCRYKTLKVSNFNNYR